MAYKNHLMTTKIGASPLPVEGNLRRLEFHGRRCVLQSLSVLAELQESSRTIGPGDSLILPTGGNYLAICLMVTSSSSYSSW